MEPAKSRTYTFGPFLLDAGMRSLWKGGEFVSLPPKVLAMLCELVERRGEVVPKNDLMSAVWPEAFVGESSLSQVIFLLRKALGQTDDGNEYIETLSKRGYRISVPVHVVPLDAPAPISLSRALPDRLAPAATSAPAAGHGTLAPASNPVETAVAEPLPVAAQSRRGWLSAGIVIVLLAVVAVGAWREERNKRPTIARFTRLTNDGLYKERLIPLLSDGLRVYFSEDVDGGSYLAEVPVEGGETQRREAPNPTASALSFSQQRRELLFGSLWEQSPAAPLLAVSLHDGAPHSIGSLSGHAASWSPQGDRIAFAKGNSLLVAEPDGSRTHELARMPDAPYWPRWSPDGKRIRFSLRPAGPQPTLWEIGADGSALHAVFADEPWASQACCGDWTPDGRHYVFVVEKAQRSALWVTSEDRHWWRRDDPVQLADGPVDFWRAPLVAPDGRHLFALGEQARGELIAYDPASQSFHPFLQNISADTLSFSRDGQWVAYTMYPEGTLWRSRVDGTERLRLTDGPGIARFPQWSPDGTEILYSTSTPENLWQVHRVAARGGAQEALLPDKSNQGVATWSADGKRVAFGQLVSFGVGAQQQRIRILDLASRKASVLPGSAGLWTARWSPDGRFLSAVTADNRRLMLYDFEQKAWKELTNVGTNDVVWSRTGDAIFFDSPDNSGVYRVDMKTRAVRRLCRLDGVRRTGFFGWSLNVTPDSQPLLLREAGVHEVYSLDVNFP